jgi:hypothetical protein
VKLFAIKKHIKEKKTEKGKSSIQFPKERRAKIPQCLLENIWRKIVKISNSA